MKNNYSRRESKEKSAYALGCSETDAQARVLISGKNEIAELIIELAKISNVPVTQNKSLAELIEKESSAKKQLNQPLSQKAILVLAEVIACLYQADKLANAITE